MIFRSISRSSSTMILTRYLSCRYEHSLDDHQPDKTPEELIRITHYKIGRIILESDPTTPQGKGAGPARQQ